MAKNALSFVCQNCGAAHGRWQGKCESCDEWNTLVEEDTGATTMPASIRSRRKGRKFALETLTGKSHEAPRLPSGMAELDRVTELRKRRSEVMKRMGDKAVMVLLSTEPRVYTNDVDYHYRQENNLYYLTGVTQPDTMLILMPGNETRREILFVKDRNAAL